MAKTKDTEPETPATTKAGGKKPPPGPTPVHIGGETIMDRLLPHVKKIAVGMLVIAVILTAVFGFRWWKDRGRAQSTAQLAKALDLADRVVEAPDPNAKPDPTDKTEKYASYKDRAIAVAAQLDRGAVDVTSNVYKGNVLLDAGKLDDADAAFRKSSGRTDLEGVLAREGLGFVAEARAQAATDPAEKQKHLAEALAAFRAVQPDDKGIHRDYALYHEARVLAPCCWQLDHKDEAIAALEKALEVVPETELESEINARLAQLEAAQ